MIVDCEVTREDIEKGTTCASRDCPLARAISRRVKAHLIVSVSSAIVDFFDTEMEDYTNTDIRLSLELMAFIKRFDCAQPVEPFKFQIEMPSEYVR